MIYLLFAPHVTQIQDPPLSPIAEFQRTLSNLLREVQRYDFANWAVRGAADIQGAAILGA